MSGAASMMANAVSQPVVTARWCRSQFVDMQRSLYCSAVQAPSAPSASRNSKYATAGRWATAATATLIAGLAHAREMSVGDDDGATLKKWGWSTAEFVGDNPIQSGMIFVGVIGGVYLGIKTGIAGWELGRRAWAWYKPPANEQTGVPKPSIDTLDDDGRPLPKFNGYITRGEIAKGVGAMGEIYLVSPESHPERLYALKVVRADRKGKGYVKRLRAEAINHARVRHKNVVGVISHFDDGDALHLVLDFCLRGHLFQYMYDREQDPDMPNVSNKELVDIFYQVADGVHATHEEGLVHRDLKPENILIAEDGTPKITDFGLAKKIKEGKTMHLAGTADLMAPEQIDFLNREIDTRTDIYNLGATLFIVFTGRAPYLAEDAEKALKKTLDSSVDVPNPGVINSDIPEPIAEIIMKAMQKDPNNRYQSASDMAAALRDAIKLDGVQEWLRSDSQGLDVEGGGDYVESLAASIVMGTNDTTKLMQRVQLLMAAATADLGIVDEDSDTESAGRS